MDGRGISTSTDPDSKAEFGPYLPGIEVIPYNDYLL